ncbi:hypothetical protein Dimus_026912 [Dionaea muscipula]
MDLTYMDHLMARRLVNLPRVMMRHMSYVISMKDHELPYGDWLTMNEICEYIKDVWEKLKYTKPLEITRRFANNETLTAARRVKSGEMKPFQRFIHFLVMKNVILRFGKRDTSNFMDLTYMDHLMARRLVNLPRVMMRHMSYVISMKDHELPYGDWLTMVFEKFGVPLVDKKGEEPKRYDYFEETFLTM